MEAIPAIDLMDGKCVRLSQGKFDQVTVFADDPVAMALKWESEGATRLHVVDLNGSRVGGPVETETIRRIASALTIPVQVGGGIRSMATARVLLDAGVDRVIIGTSAALAPEVSGVIFSELGEHAVLGVDARDGKVAVKGWEETTSEEAIAFAVRMQWLGARRVIYTDISRDGMMAGANIDAMRKMAIALDIPVIASGGVTSLDDIRRLREIEADGIEGAILGKALYLGALNLPDAIAEATWK
jgi:phosphoribosylformimino-5-aminoimidazole carboxamide ribotide isomerase